MKGRSRHGRLTEDGRSPRAKLVPAAPAPFAPPGAVGRAGMLGWDRFVGSLFGLLLLALLPAAPGASARVTMLEFYVARNGNDRWSGRKPAPAGKDGPFATLERARDAI